MQETKANKIWNISQYIRKFCMQEKGASNQRTNLNLRNPQRPFSNQNFSLICLIWFDNFWLKDFILSFF